MENTVFILGAGASCTYGLPTGNQLAEQIIEVGYNVSGKHIDLDKWTNIAINFMNLIKDLNQKQKIITKLKLLAEAFKEFDYDSIDVFLNTLPQFENYGKLLIAYLILRQENVDFLYSPSPVYINSNWPNWMKYLRKEIISNSINEKSKQKISFITFNYDRSLEYYLQKVLSRTIPDQEIDIDKYFDIIHVYGKLGNISKMKDGVELLEHESIGYGDWSDIKNIEKASKNIQLIYETRKNEDLTTQIKEKLIEAGKIYFMGFGFDQLNLDVLGWNTTLTNNMKIYGTAYNYTDNE